MTIEIFDVEQGSDAWHELRRGIPTASEFSSTLAKSEERYMRHRYRRRLMVERYSGRVRQGFTTAAMERGKIEEPRIRDVFTMMMGLHTQRIGFVRRTLPSGIKVGCSPDSFIVEEADAMLEIKSAEPHILFEMVERDTFPGEHKAQCQGAMWVCEKRACYLVVGCFQDEEFGVSYPLFIKRAERDERYIAELAAEVEKFDREVEAGLGKVRDYVPA